MSYPKVAEVIFDRALDRPLDYGIDPKDIEKAKRGIQVEVLLRGRITMGTIFKVKERSELAKLLPIRKIISDQEIVPKLQFELALWMSRYYAAPLHQILKAMVPVKVRKNQEQKQQYALFSAKTKGELRALCVQLREKHPKQADVLDVMLAAKHEVWLSELLERAKVSKSPIETLVKKGILRLKKTVCDVFAQEEHAHFKTEKKKLSEEQKNALACIDESIEKERFQPHLLWGVTGSGKTEIYMQAMSKALSLGKSAIILVPEITLTAQTMEKFKSRFDQKIAIFHHRLNDSERHLMWHKVLTGEVKIVLGARSALFSPVQNLGLIIIDEEHDSAYKQSDKSPSYHARSVAVMLAKLASCPIVLGSATPGFESFTNALSGKYQLNTLHNRVAGAKLPKVKIVDMKRAVEKAGRFTPFSEQLIEEIKKRQERGEQTLLFLNRRGYHTSLICKGCGEAYKCAHCDVSLTYHKEENSCRCHICHTTLSPPPKVCSSCGGTESLKFRGVGTELVERSLQALLPDIRTLRIDGDTTRHKGSHERLFRAFATGKADVLIGTQMITKGLHFPMVTLVAILNTDAALNIPDFRASETVFSLITQVAGRSGRAELNGEVLIQTYLPENPTIAHAAKLDYEGFYKEEIAMRKLFGFPPFSHIVKFIFTSPDQQLAQNEATNYRNKLKTKLPTSFAFHPVIPSGHAKIKDQFRFGFLVRGPGVYPITDALSDIKLTHSYKKVRLMIDVDPVSTFF